MKKFVALIFMILLCFLFLGTGAVSAGIVFDAGPSFEQSATMPGLSETACLECNIANCTHSATAENKNIIKNGIHIPASAVNIANPERGNVLKGPFLFVILL